MGQIIISTNVTLDGVVQDPDGQEQSKFGGWFKQFGDDLEQWGKLFTDEALSAQALLLGRRSDAWFASRWATRSGEWADRLNSMPKYVVSSTLERPVWNNAALLKGDVSAAVKNLKQQHDGDIIVYGSYRLAHALLARDLVDELRLFVFPVVVGGGERLFGPGGEQPKAFRLSEARAVGRNLAFLKYQRHSAS
jgi:dihydrofolate reductase